MTSTGPRPSPLRRLFGPYFRLNREIWVLFGAILINRMGNFVAPFLTLYLTQKAGATPAQTGFFVMMLPLAVVPALLAGGWLADHWGRRRVLVTGQSLAGLVYVATSLNPLGPWVPVALVAATFFAALGSVGHTAMLNDLAGPENRKTAFSLNYLGINIGFSLGPLVAGFLFSQNLGLFFLIDGLTTWFSAALVFFLTRETLPRAGAPRVGPLAEAREEGGVLRALGRRPYLLAFLAIGMVTNLAFSQHSFALPLQLAEVFGPEGPRVYGWVMTTNAVTVVLLSTLLTRWTGRWPSLTVISGAAVLYALGFGLVGWIPGLPGPLVWFLASTVVWTLGEILSSVAGQVYTASHTPENHRGRFSSLRMMATQGSTALGAVGSGLFITAFGVRALWPVVGALALAAAGGQAWLHRLEGGRGRVSPGTGSPGS